MDLTCTNPNYIFIWKTNIRNGERFELVSRERYLNAVPNPIYKPFMTRCGKCLACRLQRSYQWSNRLLAESQKHKVTYFITLTFNDENYYKVDKNYSIREWQLFIKRLRKKYKGLKLKYYATGELGSETLRFHYHAILFSSAEVFQDMYPKNGMSKYFISSTLQKIWGNGHCLIAYATQETMRYCANYVQDSKNSVCHSFSQGLGYDYMLEQQKNGSYYVGGNYAQVTRTLKDRYDINLDTNLMELIQFEKLNNEKVKENQTRERHIQKQFFRK